MSRRAPFHVRRSQRARAAALVVALGLLASACSDDTATTPGSTGASGATGRSETPRTLRVPDDHPTVQSAVDAAEPGDLILLAPGTYSEAVTVEVPRVTIRGLDRNTVILDGGDERENGFLVFSDGVAIENLTTAHYRGNGVLFSGDYGSGRILDGFRASYVTAHNNGLYGVYAFAAQNGTIDHVYGSGHPSAAVYVGQCFPCNTVVRDSLGEHNAVGFQGANAGGDLYVVTSTWRANRVGMESLSSRKEQAYPQRQAVLAANAVVDNNGEGTPLATNGFGVGIAIAGGRANRVEANVVSGHIVAGIVVTPQEDFLPEANRIESNRLTSNTVDLVFVSADGAPLDNCFRANTYSISSPENIEKALNCAPERTGGAGTLPGGTAPANVDYRAVPAPPPQPTMPDASTAPARPATGTPDFPDVATLVAPTP
ncbi:MAG TPA: hypothetical protein PKA24_05055 [Microthrixaceae bacterium]|jgi:hypothetical protein|nr:hypothetical protein [Microthrixaceae bacterium]HMT60213.1 hypothetical protein [Microthrixaceae bacterium]